MKCNNFLCNEHNNLFSNVGNCKSIYPVRLCKARKRYNRVMKDSYKSGRLRDERDKYHGRD